MTTTDVERPEDTKNPPAPKKGKKKGKAKKPVGKKGFAQFEYNGIKQFGDALRWNAKNIAAYYRLNFHPANTVGPGDAVDTVEPRKLYTYYLFESLGSSGDSARELDRLRRAGWEKCSTPRWKSLTKKFEERDGALVLGNGIWFACELTRHVANRKEARNDGTMERISGMFRKQKRGLETDGYEAEDVMPSLSIRGQRIQK